MAVRGKKKVVRKKAPTRSKKTASKKTPAKKVGSLSGYRHVDPKVGGGKKTLFSQNGRYEFAPNFGEWEVGKKGTSIFGPMAAIDPDGPDDGAPVIARLTYAGEFTPTKGANAGVTRTMMEAVIGPFFASLGKSEKQISAIGVRLDKAKGNAGVGAALLKELAKIKDPICNTKTESDKAEFTEDDGSTKTLYFTEVNPFEFGTPALYAEASKRPRAIRWPLEAFARVQDEAEDDDPEEEEIDGEYEDGEDEDEDEGDEEEEELEEELEEDEVDEEEDEEGDEEEEEEEYE